MKFGESVDPARVVRWDAAVLWVEDVLIAAVLLTLVAALPLLDIGLRCQVLGGRIAIVRSGDRARAVSRTAEVLLDRRRREVRVTRRREARRAFRLDELVGVGVVSASRGARAELLHGLMPPELERAWRDRENRWIVTLDTTSGERIPVLALAQYEVRGFLDFFTPAALALLGALGLWRSGEQVATRSARDLEAALDWCRAP